MSDQKHGEFLRSLPHVFNLPPVIRDSIYEAADYIDEQEGQIKLLNKLGNLDSTSGTSDRIAILEDRVNRMVTQMDLEQAVIQMRQEFNNRHR